MGFIYMWENKLDGMRYLGKCQGSPESSYIGSGKHFKRAVKKYGIENFERTIIEHCDSPTELIKREKYWLDFYQASTNPLFYNISPNSGGGHHGADYNGTKNPMWGRKHPNHVPHRGEDNGMFGVHRYGSENPNAKAVLIISPDNKVYEGKCLKDVCKEIFGHTDYYGRLKHLVNLCMKNKQPRKDNMFHGWTGKYKE